MASVWAPLLSLAISQLISPLVTHISRPVVSVTVNLYSLSHLPLVTHNSRPVVSVTVNLYSLSHLPLVTHISRPVSCQ
jgi:hypothetical protein